MSSCFSFPQRAVIGHTHTHTRNCPQKKKEKKRKKSRKGKRDGEIIAALGFGEKGRERKGGRKIMPLHARRQTKRKKEILPSLSRKKTLPFLIYPNFLLLASTFLLGGHFSYPVTRSFVEKGWKMGSRETTPRFPRWKRKIIII